MQWFRDIKPVEQEICEISKKEKQRQESFTKKVQFLKNLNVVLQTLLVLVNKFKNKENGFDKKNEKSTKIRRA